MLGRKLKVKVLDGGVPAYAPDETAEWYVNPIYITHTSPDSFERIADELEEWSEDNRVNGDSEIFDRAADFSERIRKLAAKDER
jgi:hypothetical protein